MRTAILISLGILLMAGQAEQNLYSQVQHPHAQQGSIEEIRDVVPWQMELPSQVKRVKVYLGHGYVFGGVELPAGEYLVVHLNQADEEGVFFYHLPYHPGDTPAVKQRCISFEGARVDKFSIDSTNQPDGTFWIRSLQFADSTEIHYVERSVIYFIDTYLIGGVEMPKGRYLIVHKKDSKNMDAPCMYFYQMPYRPGDEPVAKAHCMPTEAKAVAEFTLKSIIQPNGISAIHTIQFPGSSEAHTFAPGS